MMKKALRLILFLALAASLVSCESMRIRKQMKAFMKSEIELPEDGRFHTFLMGGDGHPVFVGNPMLSAD